MDIAPTQKSVSPGPSRRMTRNIALLEGRRADPAIAIDAIPIAVLQLDGTNRVTLVNSAAEDLLGRSAVVLTGTRLNDIFKEDAPLVDFVLQARQQGGMVSQRGLRIASPHIQPVTADVTASPDGTADGIVITFLPARLPGEEIAAEVGAFAQIARMLGHEVKNPLAGIVGAAQLLARQATADQQPLLTLIRTEGARIQRIVDRFTAFETFFNPRLRTTNVHEVLNGVVDLSRAGFGEHAEFDLQFDPSLPEIEVDPDHLHEACLNLVKNGIEAASGNGQVPRIVITTRYRAGFRFGGSRNTRARGALEIAIADNGPGVPDANSTSVFEPFFTTKSGGAGIGLAVVSEIMNAHSGLTMLDSGPGGACFRLLFPFSTRKGTRQK